MSLENKQGHICVISDAIPNPFTGGGAFTIYCVAKALKDLGYQVSAILLTNPFTPDSYEEILMQGFRQVVDSVVAIQREPRNFSVWEKIKNKLRPGFMSLYPDFQYASRVKELVSELKPDVLVIYHFSALVMASLIKDIPKMGLVGDPTYEVLKSRFAFFLRRGDLKHWLLLPFYPFLYYKNRRSNVVLLNNCQRKGAFARQHARQLEKAGVKSCKYYCSPIADPALNREALLARARSLKSGAKFNVLVFGNLKGIASVTALELLADEILPGLIESLGPEQFTLSLVGRYFDDLPDDLKRKLQIKPAQVKGFVPSLAEEFLAADVILIPTPIKLGMRIRAVTAMPYGPCLVLHSANQAGMPELQDGVNCLFGRTGKELVQKIVDCYNGRYDLVAIGKEAQATFERYFEANKAMQVILNDLRQIF